jgi:hypothetical protein
VGIKQSYGKLDGFFTPTTQGPRASRFPSWTPVRQLFASTMIVFFAASLGAHSRHSGNLHG